MQGGAQKGAGRLSIAPPHPFARPLGPIGGRAGARGPFMGFSILWFHGRKGCSRGRWSRRSHAKAPCYSVLEGLTIDSSQLRWMPLKESLASQLARRRLAIAGQLACAGARSRGTTPER
jgi:hypothetical protein